MRRLSSARLRVVAGPGRIRPVQPACDGRSWTRTRDLLLIRELAAEEAGARNPALGGAERRTTVSCALVAPAHRQRVRRFLRRFGWQELEVALEATTSGRSMTSQALGRDARSWL